MAEIDMMMPKEQGIKIKQPVEGLPQPELAMTPSFGHPERSEGPQRLPRFARNDKVGRGWNDRRTYIVWEK